MSKTLDAVLILDQINLHWRAQVTHDELTLFLARAPLYNEMDPDGMARLAQSIDDACPRILLSPNNPNNGERLHELYVGNEGSRVVYVVIPFRFLSGRRHLADRAFEQIRAAARLARADEMTATSDDRAMTIRLWWD